MASVSQFINELHRRDVFRSGAAYVVTAWLLIQVADILLETYAAPAWAMRALVTALVVGFPVALILAWIYEFTTQGVKRTGQSSKDELISSHTGRKIDFVIIGVLLVAVALFAADRFRWIDFGTEPLIDLRSIAVLPLANLSGNPEQEYFSDGMTETLITELSKISALRVISRQSVMQFKGTKLSLPEIARKLNVDAVIEGSALLIGDQVRITVQLIEAATDVHLWADNYDRDLSDVLAIHSEVARAIAHEIHIAVSPEEAARLVDVREVNPEAHRLYLLGQYHLNKWGPEDLEKATRYFQQAIELDPQYAQPHVGLAMYYGAVGFWGYMPPRIAFEKERAEATLALEIDSNLASAQTEHALVFFYLDWDWQEAEEKFQRAIALNASYAYAHQFYTYFLAAMGRTEEAHTSIRRALEFDPLSLLASMTASDVFYLSRQYDQAITQLHETLNLSPNNPLALSRLGWSYVQQGMFEEAIGNMEQAVIFSPDNTESVFMLGHAYAAAGKTVEARKILDDLHALAKKQYIQPYAFAIIHTGLGENDEALGWLEKAYQDRNGWMVFLNVEPRLDPLRSDARFQDLLHRLNYPE
ncbi:MAG: tetratricopeptide repeat protein [Proteobacteria bacterium]|nr:tetratricopeptide repeat protein [Pseudomonadota bacterium]